MSEFSSFFNSYQGDRRYSMSHLAEYFASFIGNGVFFGGNYLKVEPYGGNMDVKVLEGKGWINGYYYSNADAPKVITLDAAHLTMSRIDLIVLRLDLTEAVRSVSAVVKKGIAANTPTAPSLQRDKAIWELKLAEVRVNANVTEILVSNILDTRLGAECGIVTSEVPSDFTLEEIFNQYSASLSEKTEEWNATKAKQGVDWRGQMETQDTEFHAKQTEIDGWYNGAKLDISNLQKFDFDNLIYFKGYKYTASKTQNPTVWTETIKKVPDNSVFATRVSTKGADGSWTVVTTCTSLGIDTTIVYRKENGWEGVIA